MTLLVLVIGILETLNQLHLRRICKVTHLKTTVMSLAMFC